VPVKAVTVKNRKPTPGATPPTTVYRQRVIDALEHRQTDLTPWNFELTREFAVKLKSRAGCEDESAFLQNHMMFGRFKCNRQVTADTYEDMWGVWGAISTQGFLPFATPQQVKQKCVEAVDILGRDGGYILAGTHAVTPDIPVEGVLAMLEYAQSVKRRVYR
jgi:Uroporphyrinogen decarboxylase (URO-D)